MRRAGFALLSLIALLTLAHSAKAQLLVGSSVHGILQFNTDPANNFDRTVVDPLTGQSNVPAGYLNSAVDGATVTVDNAAKEFGFNDAPNHSSANNLIVAGFQDVNSLLSQLTITDTTNTSVEQATYTFTDSNFTGLTLTPSVTTNPFPTLVMASLSGDTITIVVPGFSTTTNNPETHSAAFNLVGPNVVPTPEFSSIFSLGGLLLAGSGGLWFQKRRRAVSGSDVK